MHQYHYIDCFQPNICRTLIEKCQNLNSLFDWTIVIPFRGFSTPRRKYISTHATKLHYHGSGAIEINPFAQIQLVH